MSRDDTLEFRLVKKPVSNDASLTVHYVSIFPDGRSPEPLPPTAPIWRYLTFAKFTCLLSRRRLWLPRVDLLGDPFEGSSPWLDVEQRAESRAPGDARDIERVLRSFRRWLVVSCWCLLESESDAMWRLYATNVDGVAIRSSVGALVHQIQAGATKAASSTSHPISSAVFAGPVFYIDFEHTESVESHTVLRFFLKRSSFAHEREYRLVAALPAVMTSEGVTDADEPSAHGVGYEIDPNSLIAEVIVAPLAPSWYEDVVRDAVQAFAPGLAVRRSRLAQLPRY